MRKVGLECATRAGRRMRESSAPRSEGPPRVASGGVGGWGEPVGRAVRGGGV
jgi:hypothetical protein